MKKNYNPVALAIFTFLSAVLAFIFSIHEKEITFSNSNVLMEFALTIMATGFVLSPNSTFFTRLVGWIMLGLMAFTFLVRFW